MTRARDRPRLSTFVSALDPDVARFVDRALAIDDVAHLAVFPDVHLAGSPDAEPACVGTAIATREWLVPAWLGSDLGCGIAGLCIARSTEGLEDPRRAHDVLQRIARAVPIQRHTTPLADVEHGHELGTIGRGNHFVELRRARHDGALWLLVHTGSRSLGPRLQALHRRAATDRRGGYARVLARSEEGAGYLADVERAVAWAGQNRRVVMERVLDVIDDHVALTIDEGTRLDTHHDSVRRERHVIDGEPRDVYVHRKGAMALGPGERGLVPGSMGADVAIVRARDDASAGALGSCPHGAGRTMTRTEARRAHEVRDLARAMHGVLFDARLARGLLDEIPSAYKDLDAVLADARPLLRVEERLAPLLVHKGIG